MPQDPMTREAARQLASNVRIQRGLLKKAIKGGDVDKYALLEGNVPRWEDAARRMKVFDLIRAFPGCGPVTAGEVCAHLGLDDKIRVRQLTYGGRKEIADLLRKVLAP